MSNMNRFPLLLVLIAATVSGSELERVPEHTITVSESGDLLGFPEARILAVSKPSNKTANIFSRTTSIIPVASSNVQTTPLSVKATHQLQTASNTYTRNKAVASNLALHAAQRAANLKTVHGAKSGTSSTPATSNKTPSNSATHATLVASNKTTSNETPSTTSKKTTREESAVSGRRLLAAKKTPAAVKTAVATAKKSPPPPAKKSPPPPAKKSPAKKSPPPPAKSLPPPAAKSPPPPAATPATPQATPATTPATPVATPTTPAASPAGSQTLSGAIQTAADTAGTYSGNVTCCAGANAPNNPIPTMPSASSNLPYTAGAGPWPVTYSDDEQANQLNLGMTLVNTLMTAAYGGASSFTIVPGVYRLNTSIYLLSVNNFAINAAGVELIAVNGVPHFRILNCTDVSVNGPLTLDADPFGGTQGVIQDTDYATYVDMQVMNGYPAPTVGTRIKFYTPQGVQLPLYQIATTAVTSMGNNVYRLSLPSNLFTSYPEFTKASSLNAGNLMSVEGAAGSIYGGVELRGNTGISFTDTYFHSYSLIWTQGELGPVTLKRVMGVRRPNTNRLGAGGYLAINLNGGSLSVDSSAFTGNYDDLTDLGAVLGYASGQPAANQVWFYLPMQAPAVGQTLHFYSTSTFADHGTAVIQSVSSASSSDATSSFLDQLSNAYVLSQNAVPVLLTLDRPVSISQLDVVHVMDINPSAISVTNSYFADGLACGICAKGAQNIVMNNNVVQRVGGSGVVAGFSLYWWEGGIPNNMVMNNNQVIDTPYSLNIENAAISVYVDEVAATRNTQIPALGTPMHNVTIQGNTVTRPRMSAISATFAANVNIIGNTINTPGVRRFDTGAGFAVPSALAAAIQLQSVSNANVQGNTINNITVQGMPEPIRMIGGPQNSGQVQLCNNQQTPAGGSQQALPNAMWTKVPFNTAAGGLYGGSANSSFNSTWPGSWNSNIGFWVANGTSVYGVEPYWVSYSKGDSVTFSFTGIRGRIYGTLGPQYGLMNFTVDGKLAQANYDASITPTYPPNVAGDPGVGVGDQLLFDSGALTAGAHTVKATVVGASGAQSWTNWMAVGISGFDYISSANANSGC